MAKARAKNANTHYESDQQNNEEGDDEDEERWIAGVTNTGIDINNNVDAESTDPLFINDSDEGYRWV